MNRCGKTTISILKQLIICCSAKKITVFVIVFTVVVSVFQTVFLYPKMIVGPTNPSSRKLFFQTEGEHCRKPQLTKTQSCGAYSQWMHLQKKPCSQRSGNPVEQGAERL